MNETPNLVVQNPTVRRYANIALGVIGIVLAAIMVFDMASDAVNFTEWSTPAFAVYSFLAGVFQVGVTVPNIPKSGKHAA